MADRGVDLDRTPRSPAVARVLCGLPPVLMMVGTVGLAVSSAPLGLLE